jgi:hypothetical protein
VSIVLQGVIRGKTIELESNPGVEDGRIVQVVLHVEQPTLQAGQTPPGEERLTAAGMMANYTEDDAAVLAQIHQERKQDTRREIQP